MATFRYDPYLWIHLAGAATVPLWLALGGLGLAVGSPRWPILELGLIIILGVLPILLMQLRRPFYIFSLVALALKPSGLTDDQRRILTLFQRWQVRLGAWVVPIPLVWLLLQLYPQAVVMSDITPFAEWGRWGGLAVAGGSFWMANLFLQVPVSVLAVLATDDRTFAATMPYPTSQVSQGFTQAGLALNHLLPTILPPTGTGPGEGTEHNVGSDGNTHPPGPDTSHLTAAPDPSSVQPEHPLIPAAYLDIPYPDIPSPPLTALPPVELGTVRISDQIPQGTVDDDQRRH